VECKKHHDKLSRNESYKVRPESITFLHNNLSKPKPKWKRRNQLLIPQVSHSIEELKKAYKKDNTSLGIIKPTKILDFNKTEPLQIYEKEGWSFTKTLDGQKIPNVIKIPHIFKYKFTCNCCQENNTIHQMQCEDWELFEAYRSWGKNSLSKKELWNKLYEKFYKWMIEKRNLYFILGMHSQYPTWFIIGLYYPPKTLQDTIF